MGLTLEMSGGTIGREAAYRHVRSIDLLELAAICNAMKLKAKSLIPIYTLQFVDSAPWRTLAK